jgi:hypothetical protein
MGSCIVRYNRIYPGRLAWNAEDVGSLASQNVKDRANRFFILDKHPRIS